VDLSPTDRAALAGTAGQGAFFEAAAERVGKIPVVVLDQAEECFTALAPAVRERWVTALARALQGASGNVRWVLSLREDFPHLVERMLDDLLGEREVDELAREGVPPTPLQIVCDRLYQARDAAGRVTLAAYETLAGAPRPLYGRERVPGSSEVFVVGGPIDYLLLWQWGYPAEWRKTNSRH
jgi:hypothetical protein